MSTRRTLLLTAAAFPFLITVTKTGKSWVRRQLRAALHRMLRARSTPWPERAAGRITLVFSPHPDDAELGCGGLIAARREAREPIHIAYITDGAASHPGHPALTSDDLAAMRKEEARLAASVLGVGAAHLHFLGAADSRLPHLAAPQRAALVGRMRELIGRLQPGEVFVTSPHDGSTEHTAAHQLVSEAFAGLATPRPRRFDYVVWARWNPTRLWTVLRRAQRIHVMDFPPFSDRKQRAIAAHRSQVEPIPPWSQPVLSEEFLSAFKGPEEFFFEPRPHS